MGIVSLIPHPGKRQGMDELGVDELGVGIF